MPTAKSMWVVIWVIQDLWSKYEATALFYELNSHLCRKYLDIRTIGSAASDPALVVVMLNPGGSEPKNFKKGIGAKEAAELDPTLKQIVKLINQVDIDCVRVLNLSDIRASNRDEFFRIKNELDSRCVPHSIFDSQRTEECASLFTNGAPVVFAWGADPRLRKLSEKAMRVIGCSSPLGWKKLESTWQFYHPLPRLAENRVKWVETVSTQIASHTRKIEFR